MTINSKQFAGTVVMPVLQMLETEAGIPYSDTAFYLVMGTIAQESLLGTWLVQESGPALGICQIEPATLSDLLSRLSAQELRALDTLASSMGPEHDVVWNLAYAVAVVRLYYWLSPAPLPRHNTVSALFATYKAIWNSPLGACTATQFAQAWALTGISLPP